MYRFVVPLLTALVALLLAACGGSDKSGHHAAPASRPAPASSAGLPIGHLLYRRYLDNSQSSAQIFAVGPGETNGRPVTHPPSGSKDEIATAAADGSRIAFTRCTDHCDLWTARPDGSGPRRLGPRCQGEPPKCVEASDPAFSPDGRNILFGRGWGTIRNDTIRYSDVFRVRASGGRAVRLTRLSGPGYRGDVGQPSYSPDGKRIVFDVVPADGAAHAGHRAIFVTEVVGGRPRRITPWSLDGGDHPRFSPDGSLILFRTDPDDGPGGDLYTIRPDGSGLQRLTHTAGTSVGMLSATFSPDGKWIAYARTADDGGNPDVWIMHADGSDATRLTTSPQWDSGPTWAP